MPPTIIPPPARTNPEGKTRRVGIEIEFHGPDTQAAAQLVQRLYGGTIEPIDEHRAEVKGTRFGDFTVELDSSYAHAEMPNGEEAGLVDRLKSTVASITGSIAGLVVPTEICAPPVSLDEVFELQALFDELRGMGAVGTRANPIFGFGMQLNVEIAEATADYITRHLQAYLLLSDWLRAEIQVDPTRRVLPFVDPFPRRYALKVVDPEYRPDLDTLIEDYLADNPTRNRELDMLPLFKHLAHDRVAQHPATEGMKIKERPTFHYRLPNSLVDDPEWGGITAEWTRWVRVEQLASDPDRLASTGRAFVEHYGGQPLSDWGERIRALLA